MEDCELLGETEEEGGISINGIKYSYSINKNQEKSLIIKLCDST